MAHRHGCFSFPARSCILPLFGLDCKSYRPFFLCRFLQIWTPSLQESVARFLCWLKRCCHTDGQSPPETAAAAGFVGFYFSVISGRWSSFLQSHWRKMAVWQGKSYRQKNKAPIPAMESALSKRILGYWQRLFSVMDSPGWRRTVSVNPLTDKAYGRWLMRWMCSTLHL